MSYAFRVLILVALVLLPTVASAEEQGDKVARTADGKLTIDSTVMAPNSCYSAGRATPGSPPDVVSVDNAILITQPLEHSGAQMCLMMLKPVQFHFTTEVPTGAQAIVIYLFDEKTKTVTARAVAIPSR